MRSPGRKLRTRGARESARWERLARALAVSVLVHGCAAGLVWVTVQDQDAAGGSAPRLVLVDLRPAEPAPEAASSVPDAVEREGPQAGPEAQAERERARLGRQIESLQDEVAGLSTQLATETRRVVDLEAAHAARVAALEQEGEDLRERVAALAESREEMATRLGHERERAADLEQAIARHREAEAAREAEMQAAWAHITAALRDEIDQKDVALRRARERLTVTIVDRVLFPSGQARLTPEGRRLIDRVARALAQVPERDILIEGHTDDVPISPPLRARFPSNWELSTARATEVVRYLTEERDFAPARLRAVGRADTEPAATNDSEEGRRQNRRIEIILLPPDQTAS